MNKLINILLIEDNFVEAEVLNKSFLHHGFNPCLELVNNITDISDNFSFENFELIICDFNLGNTNAFEVLKIFKAKDLNIPFIVFSNAVGEENAADLIRAGASDFVLKSNFQRLLYVIERGLRDYNILKEKDNTISILQKLSKTVTWELDLKTKKYSSSDSSLSFINERYLNKNLSIDQSIKNWTDLIHPEDKERVLKRREDIIRDLKTSNDEYRIILPNEEIVYLYTENSIISNKNGEPIKIVGIVQDITDRKKIEIALRESEERFKQLSDMSSEGILIHKDNNVIDFNHAFENIFGYKLEELEGKNILFLVDSSFHNILFESMKSKEGKIFEAIGIKKNGTKFPMEFSGRNVIYQGQDVRVVSIKDISYRKTMEDLIKRQENLLQIMEKLTRIVSWELDFKTGKYHFSKRLYEIFDGPDDDPSISRGLTIEKLQSYVHPEDKEFVVRSISEAIKKHLPGKIEYRLLFENNREVYVYTQSQTIFDESGKPIKRVGITQDITERKNIELNLIKAKEEAESAAKIKSEFLANMSHEIRTPMNGVVGMASLLKRTSLTERQKELVNVIISSSNDLLAIINDILDFSKIEAGEIYLKEENCNLSNCLKEVFELMSFKADEKQLKLNYQINKNVPQNIVTDTIKLKQVLINLINNAIKFTAKGEVKVTVEKYENNQIKFIIQDTGIGIADDSLHLLFKPFSQIESSSTRNFGGTGLGLAISKKLVETMEGNINVISKVGKGSEFSFTITDKTKINEINNFDNTEKLMADIYPLKILLVEDNEINRQIIEYIFEELGYQADYASNGLEALEKSENNDYDLILMDIRMPVMNGIDAAKNILESKKDKRKPKIIAMTANTMEGDKESYIKAGMDDYISKPIIFEHLQDKLIFWSNIINNYTK